MKSVRKAAMIAYHCPCTETKFRHNMNDVVEILEESQRTNTSRNPQKEQYGKKQPIADANS